MRLAVDLHIHTALSPCADKDMTPNNIVNMAVLKGLDAISITDHNSCDNVEAVEKAAGSKLLVLPGMELQTREEVHMLCYFPSCEILKDFDRFIRGYLPRIPNSPQIFGYQYIIDVNDKVVGERTESLISSVDITLEQAIDAVKLRGGIVVPAHVDRPVYGIIAQLGFIPQGAHFSAIEYSIRNKTLNRSGDILRYYSSDAHQLGDVLEREVFFDVDTVSVEGILRFLDGKV